MYKLADMIHYAVRIPCQPYKADVVNIRYGTIGPKYNYMASEHFLYDVTASPFFARLETKIIIPALLITVIDSRYC